MLDRPVAKIENLQVTFESRSGSVAALEDVTFDVRPGETVCVVGESGAGKSVSGLSLMRLVEFGRGEISGGRMLFDQGDGAMIDLAQADEHTMRRVRGNQIGMIFQEPMTALNPVFTIGRQLTEGLRFHLGLSTSSARVKALDLLNEVRLPEPERRLKQYPHELSGGMRQRVMIAMALACEPRLLIADEPTTALDVTTQAEILVLIDRLKRVRGMAVVFVTHDMAVVAQMADQVVVMQDGRVVETGPVAQIFNAPKHPYTKALLAAVPKLGLASRADEAPGKQSDHGKTADLKAASDTDADPPVLEVKGLVARYPVRGGLLRRVVANVHAVEDVSFSIRAGRTLALVGESGCGKSTVGRSILRLSAILRGQIKLAGEDITQFDEHRLRQARTEIQMVFQDPYSSLSPRMKVGAQIIEPMKNFKIGDAIGQRERAALLFERVGLPASYLDRFPHELSGGQRQRVVIARALTLTPKLIVADEAVSALDVSVQAQVLDLLMSLQKELGLAYVFISHDMALVERVSHEVAVMHLGRIVEYGPRDAIFGNPQHEYTQALLRAVPIADPAQRRQESELNFRAISSPIYPIGYEPARSVYEQVDPGHFVLTPA